MKVALIFPGAEPGVFAPYRASSFLDGLADEGFAAVVTDLGLTEASGAAGETLALGPRAIAEVPALLAKERPAVIQTFGPATRLAPVWSGAAPSGIPLVHFVSAGGPVRDDVGLALATSRLRPKLESFAGRRARTASRVVAGIIGSNRADIARHIDLGFFPRAAFSILAPPPVEARAAASERMTGSAPVFGVYDPEATAHVLSFLVRTIGLTGRPHDISFRVAPSRLRSLGAAPEAMAFVDAELDAFIGSIDALVLSYCEDRMMPALAAALKARKVVIAPDGGLAAELVEYGRHGVVYAAGSAYHLSMAINIVAQAWKNRPLDFEGADAAVARAAPREIARGFAAAYRRLVA